MSRKTMGRSASAIGLTLGILALAGCDGAFTLTGPLGHDDARRDAIAVSGELQYVVSWMEDGEMASRVLTPVETAGPVEDFYVRGDPSVLGASTGFEVADEATVLLHRDTEAGSVSLVMIYDAPVGPDDPLRQARAHLDGATSGLSFPVLDDPGETPRTNNQGVITLFNQWGAAFTDGWAARGGLEEPTWLELQLKDVTGLTGIGWVDGDGTRIPVPMSDVTTFEISVEHAPVDDTPPVIEANVTGDEGENGWYTSDVAVSWSVSDDESDVTSSTGCEDASVTEDTDGVMFTCEAVSAGGTASVSVTIKRDATVPSLSFEGNRGSYNVIDDILITCSAEDPTSGIAETACPGIDTPAWTFGPGTHIEAGKATDFAGNVGTAATEFSVTVSADGVCGLARDWAGKLGVAEGLCAKLAALDRGSSRSRARKIRAFVNQVEAVRGRWLTDEHADTLIELAGAL